MVLAWFSPGRSAFSLQRATETVLSAEAGDSAVVPPWSWAPPAGGLCIQPAGPAAAPLPSHLHQTLHCPAGPAGSHRHSAVAPLGPEAGGHIGSLDGGGPCEGCCPGDLCLVVGGCGCVVSGAAGCSPPGHSTAAGACGTGSQPGVPLASANSQASDSSLCPAQLHPGLGTGDAGAPCLTGIKLWTCVRPSDSLSGTGSHSFSAHSLYLPQEGAVVG